MRTLIVLSLAVFVTACSSAPKVEPKAEQYCDIKTKTVVVKDKNGVQKEDTIEVMECNDNRIQRLFQVQSGMAPNCGTFTYWMKLGGRDVQKQGISCQRPDGSWEIVDTVGY